MSGALRKLPSWQAAQLPFTVIALLVVLPTVRSVATGRGARPTTPRRLFLRPLRLGGTPAMPAGLLADAPEVGVPAAPVGPQ